MAENRVEEEKPPEHRNVKVDARLYEQVMVMAATMGISPTVLFEEAAVFYMVNAKEEILRRVQERLDYMFATMPALQGPEILPVGAQDG